MLENLKKYWFLVIISLILVIGTVLFTKNEIDSVFKGKKVDGKDLVLEIDDKYVDADEYYDTLLNDFAGADLYRMFERITLTNLETSKEVKDTAATQAKNHIDNVSAQGSAKLTELEQALISLGYKDLKDLSTLYENQAKLQELQRTYIKDNKETAVKDYFEVKKPRTLSHILIKMKDVTKPSDEEAKKFADVKKALEDGMSFEDAAVKYSDDPGSATQKGSLGFMDADINYDPSFLKTALETEKGKTSEWIDGTNGKHLIMVHETELDALMAEDDFIFALSNYNRTITFNSINLASESMDVKFNDETLEKELKKYMGIEGSN